MLRSHSCPLIRYFPHQVRGPDLVSPPSTEGTTASRPVGGMIREELVLSLGNKRLSFLP